MIAVALDGRLGNQLFQYAFIYAASEKLGVKFYFDQSGQALLVDAYFEIEPDQFDCLNRRLFRIKGFKNFFCYYLKRAFYRLSNHYYRLRDLPFNNQDAPAAQIGQLADRARYEGFFQSASYFEPVAARLRQRLTVKKACRQAYEEVALGLPAHGSLVVVHIRRGDYLELNLNLPATYYHGVIGALRASDPLYVFLSDDPDHIETEFAYIGNKYISRHSGIVDLQLLQHADVCVLSNSSFSWWGAWLNTRPDKLVYAPQYWSGFATGLEYPAGISDLLNYNWVTV